MVLQSRDAIRRLTVRLPAELVDKVEDAAELSHIAVDQFVERVLAKEIARWDAELPPLPAPPPDLQLALDANPAAAESFATVSRRNHAAFLAMIESAKRPDTRVRRIDKAVAMLAHGEAPYRY